MRIRKLAKELGTDDVSVLDLLRRLGHARYNDGEQQIPADLEAQVRRHARELPKLGTNTLPAPRETPIAAVPPEDTEAAMFARAMAAVKPLGSQPKAPPPKSAPGRGPPAPPPRSAALPPRGAAPPAPQPLHAPAARQEPAPPPSRAAPPAAAGRPSAPPPLGAGKPGGKAAGMVTIKATTVRPTPGSPPPPPVPVPAPGDPFAALAAVRERVPVGTAPTVDTRTPAGSTARAGEGPLTAAATRAGEGALTAAAAPPPRALEWPPRVDRLVADAPAKGASKTPPRPASARGPAPTSAPARPVAATPAKRTPPPELLLAEEQARAAALAAQLADAHQRVADAEQLVADAEGRATLAEARVAELEASLAAAEARAHEVDQHRRQLQRDLSSAAEPPGAAPLRACFERRGLLGDDEIAAALRALLDGHRVAELGRIGIADADQLEDLLWERVLLLAEDEAPPPGVVAVRVPEERSEGRQASVNRAAMSRFATACLIRNIRRVVIVGGSPAYHRMLKEGLDPRLDLRLIPGNRRGRVPQVPGADLVILWASTILDHSVSAQFPEGVVIPHRGIARMLGAATEWIESRPD